MRMQPRFLLLLAVLLPALACDDSPSPSEPGDIPVPFQTVAEAAVSGYVLPSQEVIRTAEEWAQAWATLYAGQGSVPARPAIDFSRDMVVLAALGTGSNSCYRIEVSAVTLRNSRVEIEVKEIEPGPSCACLAVMTQPVHAVRLERQDRPETFRIRRQQLAC